jgi:hypothetical protein
LFVDADSTACRRFLERVFQVEAISGVTITEGDSARAGGRCAGPGLFER